MALRRSAYWFCCCLILAELAVCEGCGAATCEVWSDALEDDDEVVAVQLLQKGVAKSRVKVSKRPELASSFPSSGFLPNVTASGNATSATGTAEDSNSTSLGGVLTAELDALQNSLGEETAKLEQVANLAAQAGVLTDTTPVKVQMEPAVATSGTIAQAIAAAKDTMATLQMAALLAVGVVAMGAGCNWQKKRQELAGEALRIEEAKQLLQVDQILAFRRQPWPANSSFPDTSMRPATAHAAPGVVAAMAAGRNVNRSSDQTCASSSQSSSFVIPLGSVKEGSSGRTVVHMDIPVNPALWPLRARLLRDSSDGPWDRIELTHDVTTRGHSIKPVLCCQRPLPITTDREACLALEEGAEGAPQVEEESKGCSWSCEVMDSHNALVASLGKGDSSSAAGVLVRRPRGDIVWQIKRFAAGGVETLMVHRLQRSPGDVCESEGRRCSKTTQETSGDPPLLARATWKADAPESAPDASDSYVQVDMSIGLENPEALQLLLAVLAVLLLD